MEADSPGREVLGVQPFNFTQECKKKECRGMSQPEYSLFAPFAQRAAGLRSSVSGAFWPPVWRDIDGARRFTLFPRPLAQEWKIWAVEHCSLSHGSFWFVFVTRWAFRLLKPVMRRCEMLLKQWLLMRKLYDIEQYGTKFNSMHLATFTTSIKLQG